MNDREMLEWAAKAAGNAPSGISYLSLLQMANSQWRPREDDGDAFRLGVKLRLFEDNAWMRHLDTTMEERAGARKAFVRAAAEIGRAMP